METTSISTAVASSTGTSGAAGAKKLTDQFLTLLVAQLKNQDPTNPMDNQDFVSELAQLQSLDQQQKLAETNQGLLLQSSLATGSSMIGKDVTGNAVVAGEFVEVSGMVESLKVENGQVIFRVRASDGDVVSMASDNLKTVSTAGLNSESPTTI
jgi:flagellar basal-body rod modification protein FlgD